LYSAIKSVDTEALWHQVKTVWTEKGTCAQNSAAGSLADTNAATESLPLNLLPYFYRPRFWFWDDSAPKRSQISETENRLGNVDIGSS